MSVEGLNVEAAARDLAETLFYTTLTPYVDPQEGAIERQAWQFGPAHTFNALLAMTNMPYEVAERERRRLFREYRDDYMQRYAGGRRLAHIPSEITYRACERVFHLAPGSYSELLAEIVDRGVNLAKKMYLQRKN